MPSPYVKPVQGQIMQYDQGIDFQGKPGDHVVAVGLARIDAVKDNPGGFGKAIYYTLLNGPNRGQQIYVGHAEPTVKPGVIVQAGQPVATLLQHGLGNAGNLAGWTEIGFAKNGVPEGPSSPTMFRMLYNKAQPYRTITNPAPAPQPAADTSQQQQAPVQAFDTTSQTPAAPPDVTQTQPQVLPPGSGGVQNLPVQLWQRIISQPGASPDTLAYAQNAAIATTGG